ncbi:hypothetical protein C8F01DRAFT_1252907 [Mycena amicta]|nr:hypothetical protein C8F01DRAFT_1252907 [Mycena amicta]
MQSVTFAQPSLQTAFRVALVWISHSCTSRQLVPENGTAFVVVPCAASAARALGDNGAEQTPAHLKITPIQNLRSREATIIFWSGKPPTYDFKIKTDEIPDIVRLCVALSFFISRALLALPSLFFQSIHSLLGGFSYHPVPQSTLT